MGCVMGCISLFSSKVLRYTNIGRTSDTTCSEVFQLSFFLLPLLSRIVKTAIWEHAATVQSKWGTGMSVKERSLEICWEVQDFTLEIYHLPT